jgi:hypothetical protein
MQFPNLLEAARFFKVTKSEILDCCFGERKTLKKRRWGLVEVKASDEQLANTISTEDYYNNKGSLPVDCLSTENVLLHRFETVFDVTNALSIDSIAKVVNCCLGKRASVVGFKFRFRENNKNQALGDSDASEVVALDTEVTVEELLKLRRPPIPTAQIPPNTAIAQVMKIPSATLADDPPPMKSNDLTSRGIPIAVDCFSLDGITLLRRFLCINDVRKALHINKAAEVKECCNGNKPTAFGFV